MSGHSKWATTKHRKTAQDAKRSAIFTKVGNLISIAARKGVDPETNFALRLAIEKARVVNMPKENIERAIKRGTGELGGDQIVERVYEAFGPQGIAIIIEATTDNLNRTTADIKHILSKHGASLGRPNSSLWQFSKKGVIRLTMGTKIPEEVELELIEAGVEDISNQTLFTPPENFQKIKEIVEQHHLALESADVEFIPSEEITIASEVTRETIKKLFEALDELDEVNEIYTNAKLS